MSKPIYVIGHKNPDTDSICSAIAYSNLMNKIAERKGEDVKYIPKRAGHTNPETKYVIKHFGVRKPGYVDTLEPRIKDCEFRRTEGIDQETSIKRAWEKMKDENLRTMPVFDDDRKLIGLITQGDIARALMEENDTSSLSESSVSCRNILDTLDGQLIVGDIDAVFDKGTIAIGAANPEVMIQHIKPDSMVIMGNRADAQISALEQGAKWLIVSLGSEVFDTIKTMAKHLGCNIISTPYSTYMVARLINQSMPVRHVMHTGDFTLFYENDFVSDVKKIMTKKRLRYFPVMDKDQNFVGLVSQRNLLDLEKQSVILVDHNETTQCVDGIDAAEVIEVIDHHRIGDIRTSAPVYFRNQPLGCTCTIVARMYEETGTEITKEMAGIMCAAILSDTLCFKSPTCTVKDVETANKLADIAGIDVKEFAREMFEAGSQVSDKTDDELFYRDFKVFSVEGNSIGVAQLNIMGSDVIKELEDRMLPYIEDVLSRTRLDIVIFMMTDIMSETSRVIYTNAKGRMKVASLISAAFNVEAGEHSVTLPGVVSRKKQMMPTLTYVLQNM